MRPLATYPITLQLLAVLKSAQYKDLHAQEGTSMLQCWYVTNRWCHSEFNSECGSTRCHNCSHYVSPLVAWPVKLKQCYECWASCLIWPRATYPIICAHRLLQKGNSALLPRLSPQRWLTFPTSFTRGARPWVLVSPFNAFLFSSLLPSLR